MGINRAITDHLIGPAKASIQLQQVTYTSAFRYNETSRAYYREYDTSEPQYIGTPNKDIDKAWGKLLSGTIPPSSCNRDLTKSTGQYLVLSEDEAQELENPVPIKGLYLAE